MHVEKKENRLEKKYISFITKRGNTFLLKVAQQVDFLMMQSAKQCTV